MSLSDGNLSAADMAAVLGNSNDTFDNNGSFFW